MYTRYAEIVHITVEDKTSVLMYLSVGVGHEFCISIHALICYIAVPPAANCR